MLWLLKRAFHQTHHAVDEAVRTHGITASQLGVLNRLVAEPGLSGAELARRLLITPQAAQLALAALERQGLVERKPDPEHGRIVRSWLTEEGRRAVDRSMAKGLEAEARSLAVLDADERRTLFELLLRLVDQSAVAPGSDASGGAAESRQHR